MPNERSRHSAPDCHVSAGKMNDGNHSVSRIAETKIWNTVADEARLFPISRRRQHDDGNVPISCRKLVAVDIDEANRMSGAS